MEVDELMEDKEVQVEGEWLSRIGSTGNQRCRVL